MTKPPTERQPSAPQSGVTRIAVPKPLFRLFDYTVPEGQPLPAEGARVVVPFGRQQLTGVCIETNPVDAHADLKPLTRVLDDEPALPSELLALAHWLAEYYQHPLGEVLSAMLPADARKGAPLLIKRVEAWTTTGSRCDLKRAPRQRELLRALAGANGTMTTAALRAAGFSRALIRAVAGKGLITKVQSEPATGPGICEAGPTPTAEQAAALAALADKPATFAPTLLEGVTGSGKTEIYLRLIDTVRKSGRQVLVLVPEIALTPQTTSRFERRFGSAGGVASLHSNLTDPDRLQTWLKCRSGEVSVLIGTRSAVLTPFRDLGLIVVDEEHDGSFKQQDGLRYSARDVAVKRAQGLGIPLLLGSATPSLETLHNALQNRYAHLSLTRRAGGASMPHFRLLDIRGQTLTDGLSQELIRGVRQHLDQGGQVLMFLNRRGFAPSYLCTRCGWQAVCARCEMRMTLHRAPGALICHHCGHRRALPDTCPDCDAADLLAVGVGTQRAESGIAQLFPDAPIHRIDRDTTRSQKRMEQQLAAIGRGEPAVLVGTQMLAKGHHFPKVTLVAVINADGGFLSADFRAPERTAQLIIQVAGRAGRAESPGEVWIQTYQPESRLLQSLIRKGYPGFARRELAIRERAGLPPFRAMALLRAESADADAARDCLSGLRDQLPSPLEVLGPAPAPIARVADRFRYQLMVMADTRARLHRGLRRIRGASKTARVRWSVDVDPYDTF